MFGQVRVVEERESGFGKSELTEGSVGGEWSSAEHGWNQGDHLGDSHSNLCQNVGGWG